ncbi:MAG: hypothetical protein OEQ13_07015 [Acidobacteriota bacterium]|nr:hypothetical protein [Acidobacteriota bacterium]
MIAAAAALAVLGVAALYLQRGDLLGGSEPDPCEQPLVLIADDGRRLDVLERCCEPRRGRHPAILVRVTDRRAGIEWARALERFSREGRVVWVLAGASPEDQELADLRVAIEALGDESVVDPGRIGLVVAREEALQSIGVHGQPFWNSAGAGAAAAVIHVPGATPPEMIGNLEIIEEERISDAAPRAEAFLADQLELPPS